MVPVKRAPLNILGKIETRGERSEPAVHRFGLFGQLIGDRTGQTEAFDLLDSERDRLVSRQITCGESLDDLGRRLFGGD